MSATEVDSETTKLITNKNTNMTRKQLIVDYVAMNDGASYSEIIKFIYEYNHGKGTFDPVENRGYYSSGFSKMCRYSGKDSRYLLQGDGIKKMPNGKYYAIRKLSDHQKNGGTITDHMLDWIFDNGPVSYTDMNNEYMRYTKSNSFSCHLPNLSNSNTNRPCRRFIIKDTTSGRRGLWSVDAVEDWDMDYVEAKGGIHKYE